MENKIIDKRIVHEWRFVNKIEVDEQTEAWKIKTWEWASRTWTGEAVWVLVENKEKWLFVLVEQFRPLVNSRVLELVAWLVDVWDSVEKTVSKEIKEETWYITKKIQFLMAWPKSPWFWDEYSSYFYAEVNWEQWEQELEESEIWLEVIEIKNTISDLLKLCNEKVDDGIMVSWGIWWVVWRAQAMWIEFNK